MAAGSDRAAPDSRPRLTRRAAIVAAGTALVCALAAAAFALRGGHASGRGWEGFGGSVLPGADWRPYSDSSPFNQTVGSVPVVAHSAAIVADVLGRFGRPAPLYAGVADTSGDYGHPTFYAQPTDPIYTLHATNRSSRAIEGMRIPIPRNARPAAGGDGHMTVITPDGWEYDFWQVQDKPPDGGTLTYHGAGRTRIDGTGLGSGATAALFGNLAGMIRAPELISGHIDHALFIVLKCTSADTSFGYHTTTSPPGTGDGSYVYPAQHGGSACPTNDPNLPPLGARFRLNMTDTQIHALTVPAWKKTILTALAHYGGYLGDTGGPGFGLMLESSTTYTALGQPDPLIAFADHNHLPTYNGQYVLNIANNVNWQQHLQVITPPNARRASH